MEAVHFSLDIPAAYFKTGTWYDTFKAQFESVWQQPWEPGTAVFQYANDQHADAERHQRDTEVACRRGALEVARRELFKKTERS